MLDTFALFDQQTTTPEHLKLFHTAQVLNPQSGGRPQVVVSTSLYWGTHGPHYHLHRPASLEALQKPSESVRGGGSWWENYFLPFMRGCEDTLPAGWARRVYLAADLSFLIPHIPACVEIHLMALNSWASMPGMLWRYLPAEEPVLCVARGADNFHLGATDLQIIHLALHLGTFLVRTTTNEWQDERQRLIYRSIHGPCIIRGPLSIIPAAAAWIATNQRALLPATVPAYPHLTHVGLNHWGAYGQDEQFLCRWLYYRAAAERTITLVSDKGDHELFQRDMAYLHTHGKLHSVIRR